MEPPSQMMVKPLAVAQKGCCESLRITHLCCVTPVTTDTLTHTRTHAHTLLDLLSNTWHVIKQLFVLCPLK